jgi:hypothetical protein
MNEPNSISILDINTPLIGGMCDECCKNVLDVPCVEQPFGHACGACNVNTTLVLEAGTFENLINN